MNERPAIGFIGAGRTATALATALVDEGYPVTTVASRSFASAQRLAVRLGPGVRACRSPQEVADACGLVFLTTPDDAIAKAAAEIKWRAGQMAVHCSGALSTDVLEPVSKAGGLPGVFHPVQSLAAERQNVFRGITFGLEGAGALLALLQRMAEDLGARWVLVPAGGKAVYHAGAVLASNYVVTLLATGTDLLAGLGIPREEALDALLGLLRGTLRNLEEVGVPDALTGPIARGDAGTVKRHLATLAASPELAGMYRALGRLTIPVALAKGSLSKDAAQELERVLGVGRPLSRGDAASGLTDRPLATRPGLRGERHVEEFVRGGSIRTMRTMLSAKIHRATVTDANINYEGSITLDTLLMEAAGILPYEQVHVLDVDNGARLVTYAIEGERGSGIVCINGAAARLVHKGDIVILLTYEQMDEPAAQKLKPRLVYVDKVNKITNVGQRVKAATKV